MDKKNEETALEKPAEGTVTPPEKTAEQPAQKPETKTFTQDEVNTIVAERLKREDEKKARELDKARADAEEKALEDNAKWKELAEKRDKRISELEAQAGDAEALKQELDGYRNALTTQLKAEKEGLPAHILALVDKLNPIEQLEYLAANRAALGATQQKKYVPGSPRSDEMKSMTDAEKESHRRDYADTVRNMF